MHVVSINLGNFGSTGTIMRSIGEFVSERDAKVMLAYPESPKNVAVGEDDYIICSNLERRINEKLAYMTGIRGCCAWISTKRFIKKLKKISPDIIHLHNLHNNYLNLGMLFHYIKKNNIHVVWTMHDCWPITGQCPHFTIEKCDKWKNGCYHCRKISEYPKSKYDNAKLMWNLKKKWFTGIKNMVIVTPSVWLKEIVEDSFLNEYPVKVINNGINLDVFKPTESNFREIYNCRGKKIILGVAFDWGYKKGLDVFIDLATNLPKNYQIVLVGTNETIDLQLPKNIISIHRTANQVELAKIYTAVDLFVNPTREENYPTVNMEAIACGTPVLTYRTGGSPEIVDESCGCVVDYDDKKALQKEIIRILENFPYTEKNCLKRAEMFDVNRKYEEYVRLYDSLQGTNEKKDF